MASTECVNVPIFDDRFSGSDYIHSILTVSLFSKGNCHTAKTQRLRLRAPDSGA